MPIIAEVCLPAGTLKRIHINTLVMRQCIKSGDDQPIVIVRTSGKVYHGRCVVTHGEARTMQDIHGKMPGCAARAWQETRGAVNIYQVLRIEEDQCVVTT